MNYSKCKICGGNSVQLFNTKVLGKYGVAYFQCAACDFIQTEEPYWLDEAYQTPIASLDVGLLSRNLTLSDTVASILDSVGAQEGTYLDYGGGYGIFVRLMRDRGYNFFLYDKYAKNLFARYFDLAHMPANKKIEALTAFEVFEHLTDPMHEIEKMFSYSDVIIFSTQLQPRDKIQKISDWWYFVPESGQHISFYHYNTLRQIEKVTHSNLYSNGSSLHVLSKIPFERDPFSVKKSPVDRLRNFMASRLTTKQKSNRTSLLTQDFEFYKTKLLTDHD